MVSTDTHYLSNVCRNVIIKLLFNVKLKLTLNRLITIITPVVITVTYNYVISAQNAL